MSPAHTQTAAIPAAVEYYDLGAFHRLISTDSADAQTWFNHGLLWAYAFNHEESARCFGQVIAHDPTYAMGYWGIAYARGPNYNKKWEAFDKVDLKATFKTCHQMSQTAKEHLSTA
ncbi:hypothetical protein FOCG_16755 [Fusarium oxysporum f. sp. radicis-lycopersici 26381]|nr:hypothetical protein FOCG_16755 [Fusarium oxysporum f. sp. radicis-lycopersici 26381]